MLLPPLISVLLAAGAACASIWIVAEVGRRLSVKGSQGRFVWASVERGQRYPALIYFSMSAAVEGYFYKDWFLFAIAAAGVALWFVLWQEKKRNGDDDDFWSRTGKRLKQRFARLAPAPSAA